jgi:4-alpha-glucanotransferase
MHRHNCVVYTGTHDNDTTVGWFATLEPQAQRRVAAYLGSDSMPQALIRAACASVAQLAVVPMQDLLGLGSAARFNTPGTKQGNWSWKLEAAALNHDRAQHYAGLNRLYARA